MVVYVFLADFLILSLLYFFKSILYPLEEFDMNIYFLYHFQVLQ